MLASASSEAKATDDGDDHDDDEDHGEDGAASAEGGTPAKSSSQNNLPSPRLRMRDDNYKLKSIDIQ